MVIPERTERKYKPYPEYRNLGIEWLEEIPSHWEIKKLKHVSFVKSSSVDKHSKEDEEPIRLCNYTDVYNCDTILPGRDFMEATATRNEIAMFSLKKDDVIITKDSEDWRDIAVPSYVPADLPDIICGYHLALIKPKPSAIIGRYLFWAFYARNINYQFAVASTGITRFGLGKHWLDTSLFLIPPIQEQQVIADFLDCETNRIEELIARKKRLIELLQEQRTALITHAVTRGINPDAPMKDSGVEWLGKVPAHWGVKKLKHVTRCLDGQRIPLNAEQRGKMQGEYPYWGANGIIDYVDSWLFDENLVLLGEDGAPFFEAGKTVSFLVRGKIWVNNHAHVLRPMESINPKLLVYILNTVEYRSFIDGSTRDKLTQDDMRDIPIQFPPLSEQQAIADYLDQETARIDSLIGGINQAIKKLQEYRTVLITAAVTGKIDVRQRTS